MTVLKREVLLVEDDPDDVMLMSNALKNCGKSIEIKVVGDGIEALQYLRGEGPFVGAVKPDLILLDWRLPRMNGEEVLREIRKGPGLQLIPVLVLTTSAAEADIQTAYSLGANAFLTKPTGIQKLDAMTKVIGDFWLVFASLPSTGYALARKS